MRHYTIPLTPEAQSLGITLAGKEYRLTVRWMDAPEQGATAQQTIAGTWLLDVAEPENAAPIVKGLPLVAGCDLLEPFAYLDFNGELWLDSDVPATQENLGEAVKLVFSVEDVE